jgi:hypothetical protein
MAEGSSTSYPDERPVHETELLDVPLDSPALRRLIDEVRGEEKLDVARSYDRTYNRHNR